VQGFGNVGYWAAKHFHAQGAKIIGVCEKNSAIYNEKGPDPEDVKIYFTANGTLHGY
jgi:glutamate dehydrogenase (NAD(P)+)